MKDSNHANADQSHSRLQRGLTSLLFLLDLKSNLLAEITPAPPLRYRHAQERKRVIFFCSIQLTLFAFLHLFCSSSLERARVQTGFIGSNVLVHLVTKYPDVKWVCFDKLNYCGTSNNFKVCSLVPECHALTCIARLDLPHIPFLRCPSL